MWRIGAGYVIGPMMLATGIAVAVAATEHAVARSVLALALLGYGSHLLAHAWEARHRA